MKLKKYFCLFFIFISIILIIFFGISLPFFIGYKTLDYNNDFWIELEKKIRNNVLLKLYYNNLTYFYILENYIFPAAILSIANFVLGIKIRTKKVWWIIFIILNFLFILFFAYFAHYLFVLE
jgi:hypothetical protein